VRLPKSLVWPQRLQGLDAYQAIVGGVALPHYYALLTEAYVCADQPKEGLALLTDAQAVGRCTGDRWWEAELYRLQGTLLLRQSTDQAMEAESCFH
jgi:hypothetical protein